MSQYRSTVEVQFDGLVGPTHHYAGLSYGNVASILHQSQVSNPRQAALEGLEKMKFIMDLGIPQAILPPQERPDFKALGSLGFSGNKDQILKKAIRTCPELFSACSSASSMWTANAATVSPSADTQDGKVHFTISNLNQKFHRSIESEQTLRTFRTIFQNSKHFTVHSPLPNTPAFGDEGAANHGRLQPFAHSAGTPGLEVFVYGQKGLHPSTAPQPKRYPARQTRETCEAIARRHLLHENRVFIVQQNPAAIDAGAFHNDVISVLNDNMFFLHEEAFVEQGAFYNLIHQKYAETFGADEILHWIEVPRRSISLQECVESYVFNSQLISLKDHMLLVAPEECTRIRSVHDYLQGLLQQEDQPIREVHYFNLKQSMQNGGGPACLRLRVTLTPAELEAVHPGVFLSPALYEQLKTWINRHYRDRLVMKDLQDLQLYESNCQALDELTQILNLGSLYPFQQAH